jgi:hypothetical protein
MSTKTKSTKTKTTRKAPSRAELKKLAREVAKDPQAATEAQRLLLVGHELIAGGLRGKARTQFIKTGELPSAPAAKAARAKASSAKRKSTGRKAAAGRPIPIHEAIQSVLAQGPMEQAELAEQVSKLRGKSTAVRPYLADPNHKLYRQHKSGKWALSR